MLGNIQIAGITKENLHKREWLKTPLPGPQQKTPNISILYAQIVLSALADQRADSISKSALQFAKHFNRKTLKCWALLERDFLSLQVISLPAS